MCWCKSTKIMFVLVVKLIILTRTSIRTNNTIQYNQAKEWKQFLWTESFDRLLFVSIKSVRYQISYFTHQKTKIEVKIMKFFLNSFFIIFAITKASAYVISTSYLNGNEIPTVYNNIEDFMEKNPTTKLIQMNLHDTSDGFNVSRSYSLGSRQTGKKSVIIIIFLIKTIFLHSLISSIPIFHTFLLHSILF
jgi:hypothetical protein